MSKKTVLVIADLGGCPPHMFYESAAASYHIVSYIPRPFAITKGHAELIEKYSIAVIKDRDYFETHPSFEHPDSIYWAHDDYPKSEEEVVEDFIRVASFFKADAITTNNELFIAPMAKAAERLGLRGAGVKAAEMARDKSQMRAAFNASGVKAVKTQPVTTLSDFQKAIDSIGTPLILKPTYLASSIGVTLFHDKAGSDDLFLQVQSYLETIPVPDAVTYEAPFVAETYLEGAYEDWYEDEGYADYVSVEGLVVEGEYLPFVIHDKTPQIGFTETAHITPTILDNEAKQIIIEAARKANEGLGLEHCATHTEIKLMKNRETGLIESAARFAGWNMIPNIKKVFGVDMAKLLIDVLVDGKKAVLPKQLLSGHTFYVADCHLYPQHFKESGLIPPEATHITIDHVSIPEEAFVGDTAIVNQSFPAKGTMVDLALFEAFNGIVSLELKGSSSQDVAASIRNIQKQATIQLMDELVKG
ncbi:ATP-grasp domain-containing protein [Bacillus altitudinis]|uniref:ATP-grasp domain-containing protein n=1 Tax=Bacillus altitudinis TaxID=293387 RepID=UPI0013C57054|nr:ATP-grasp domain-containing protein [Bacillus altitudinis]NEU51555.1 ATP-grasp domain-containing protein [Bacillus altitudinis]